MTLATEHYPDAQIGVLRDGSPIMGTFDTDGTQMCVTADMEGFFMTFDEDGFCLRDGEANKDYGYITLAQLERLRGLFAGSDLDCLITLAQAWGRGEALQYATPHGCDGAASNAALPIVPRHEQEQEEAEEDEPEEFTIEIGAIDGCPVTATYSMESNTLLFANMDWCGMHLSTDGETFLNTGATGDAVGDVTIQDWGRIRELARTDIVERLITLVRKHTIPPQNIASLFQVAAFIDHHLDTEGNR